MFSQAEVKWVSTGFEQLKSQLASMASNLEMIKQIKLTENMHKMREETDATEKSVKNLNTTINRLGSGGSGSRFGSSNTAREIRDLITLAVGGSMAAAPIKIGAEFEVLEVNLKNLIGSSSEAKKRYADLIEYAATTPFQFKEVANMARTFEVFGGAALSNSKMFKIVGDAAAATGRELELVQFWVARLHGMLKDNAPIGQEAIHMQRLGILSEYTRNKIEALQKSGADGSKIFEVFAQSLERFTGGAKELSLTLSGQFSNLKDYFSLVLGDIGKNLGNLLKPLMADLISFFQDFYKNASPFTKQILAIVVGFGSLITILSAVGFAFTLLKSFFTPFGAALGWLFKLISGGAAANTLLLGSLVRLQAGFSLMNFSMISGGFSGITLAVAGLTARLVLMGAVLVPLVGYMAGKMVAAAAGLNAGAGEGFKVALDRFNVLKKETIDATGKKDIQAKVQDDGDVKRAQGQLKAAVEARERLAEARTELAAAKNELRRVREKYDNAGGLAIAAYGTAWGTEMNEYKRVIRELEKSLKGTPANFQAQTLVNEARLNLENAEKAAGLAIRSQEHQEAADRFHDAFDDAVSKDDIKDFKSRHPDEKWPRLKIDSKTGMYDHEKLLEQTVTMVRNLRRKEKELAEEWDKRADDALQDARDARQKLRVGTLEDVALDYAKLQQKKKDFTPGSSDSWGFYMHTLQHSLKNSGAPQTMSDIAKKQLKELEDQNAALQAIGLTEQESKKLLENMMKIKVLGGVK